MKKYWPLACLILVAAIAACALAFGSGKGWMSYFMGFFLCQFALLKLFNPVQFADGFQMYDLIAGKSRAYAFDSDLDGGYRNDRHGDPSYDLRVNGTSN